MPAYTYRKKPKTEKVVAEHIITEWEAAELLGVDRDGHWFRVVHELSTGAPPWAVVRLQALKR